MILGTHNCLTSYPLKGWFCKAIAWLCNLTAKCQELDLEQQLLTGVRLFNIQVNKKDGEWIGSHGLAWYDITVDEAFQTLEDFALSANEKIYVIFDYDRHLFVKNNNDEFKKLLKRLQKEYKHVKIIQSTIEYGWESIQLKSPIQYIGAYWMWNWAKNADEAKDYWYRYVPFPHFWAKKLNNYWMAVYHNAEYLMIDFA